MFIPIIGEVNINSVLNENFRRIKDRINHLSDGTGIADGSITAKHMAIPTVNSTAYTMNSTNWDNETVRLAVNGTLLWVRIVARAKTAVDDTTTQILTIDLAELGVGTTWIVYPVGYSDGGNTMIMLHAAADGTVSTVGMEPVGINAGDILQVSFVAQIASWA